MLRPLHYSFHRPASAPCAWCPLPASRRETSDRKAAETNPFDHRRQDLLPKRLRTQHPVAALLFPGPGFQLPRCAGRWAGNGCPNGKRARVSAQQEITDDLFGGANADLNVIQFTETGGGDTVRALPRSFNLPLIVYMLLRTHRPVETPAEVGGSGVNVLRAADKVSEPYQGRPV